MLFCWHTVWFCVEPSIEPMQDPCLMITLLYWRELCTCFFRQYYCSIHVLYVLLYVLLLQKILTMDQYDCGKRYVCELGVLAVVEEEEDGEGVNLRDSELALLSLLEVGKGLGGGGRRGT